MNHRDIDFNQSYDQRKNQNYYDSDQEEEDDLHLFEQHKRVLIIKQNNLNHILYEEDKSNPASKNTNPQQKQPSQHNKQFNQFYGNQQQEMRGEILKKDKHSTTPPQINEEQISAKKLRAFNAAKYFQKIKLMLIKQIYNATHELVKITEKRSEVYEQNHMQFNIFLSLLPADVLVKFFDIKNKNMFAIDDNEVLSTFRDILTDEMIKQFRSQALKKVQTQNKILTKNQLLFKLAELLHCKIKKVSFFNIQNFVDQTFYNLDFQKNERKTKKNKKTTKIQEEIKNRIKRHVYEQDLDDTEYVDLNNFQFSNVVKNSSKNQQELDNQIKVSKKRGKKIQEMKKYFQNQTYQIFSFLQAKWKMFMSIQGHFQEVDISWFRESVLNSLPIVGFYSLETLIAKKEYEQLFELRKTKNIVIKDMSVHFYDNWRKLVARRKRVGIRPIMNKIFRFFNYKKPLDILQDFEAYQYEHTTKQMRQILIKTQLPKTNIQFTFSDYFLTPSRVGKYHILSPQSKPIQNTEDFNEQRIYWKDDLIPVCSRMGWIDFSRMVRAGQEPLKKTQNRNKKQIQLYRYEQTKPFVLQIEMDGNFVLDPEHSSIYVPPNLELPENTCLVKQKISFVCNKNKIKFAKLVQGFIHGAGMRILPNEIGFIIYTEDRQRILKLYEERQYILNQNKESRYDQRVQKMWREILKYVKLIERMGGQNPR